MKVCFITSGTKEAEKESSKFQSRYGQSNFNDADVIVVFGGDGLVLRVLHKILSLKRTIPVYAMNMGNLGFLANIFDRDNDLISKMESAVETKITPLKMCVKMASGEFIEEHAINEIYLFRKSHQAAKIKIIVDGILRLNEFVGDGIIYSSPVGSTAYNYSSHGPILPLNSGLVVMTPISPFRPKSLGSAILNEKSSIRFEITENLKRPVNIIADFVEYQDIIDASVSMDFSKSLTLLFDQNNQLSEKIIKEQFS